MIGAWLFPLPVAQRYALCVALLVAGWGGASAVAAERYSFGVVSQRSAVVTAQYWNPILAYAGTRASVGLELHVARTGNESADAAARGDYDFVFSNHIFQPRIAPVGYRVIARTRDEPITGQIVALESSPIRSLPDLAGREVGFPSTAAVVAYGLTMDELMRRKIAVVPVFGGNQEGIMAQLKAGRVAAAGVNGKVMRAYAEREGLRYRVLWESALFNDQPIAVHPRVPKTVAAAVRDALAGMAEDGEGARILAEVATVVGQKPPLGFRAATAEDYRNYVDFYRNTRVTGLH